MLIKKRFISYDNERTFYINKFCPDDNLVENIFITKKPDKYSIIMQYLYHISGYNKEKFNYIMSWLSSMMRYILNHEDTIFNSNISVLVLVGGENAGMEIFFNNIIKPLFGSGYCLAIDNEKLSEKNLEKDISNKIFYNLDCISSHSIKNKKIKKLLHDILTKQDKNTVGTLITTDKKYIPYDLSNINYSVFNLPDDIESLFIPKEYADKFNNLKEEIISDLHNFSSVLKYYIPIIPINDKKDIDITKKLTLEDCIIEFADKIIVNRCILQEIKNIIINTSIMSENDLDNTLKSIEKLYNKHKKIERKYIYELFKYKYDYDISPTVLYKKLTELDQNFFQTVLAPGGAKCFYFPNFN